MSSNYVMEPDVDVEIVTHCWRYSRSLAYQISGLILNPPQCDVQLTVFCNPEHDKRTLDVIQAMRPSLPENVFVVSQFLETNRLFRRSIGRNEACLHSPAKSCIILTDADYIWPGRAIDEVLQNGISAEAVLTYPCRYWKQVDHSSGDAYLALQDEPKVLGLESKDFESCRIGKAIGGIQVYRADVARELGYLSGTKWLNPHRGPRFACCRCDKAFRYWLVGKGHKIKDFEGGMPWRIRHSVKGREVTEVDN